MKYLGHLNDKKQVETPDKGQDILKKVSEKLKE